MARDKHVRAVCWGPGWPEVKARLGADAKRTNTHRGSADSLEVSLECKGSVLIHVGVFFTA